MSHPLAIVVVNYGSSALLLRNLTRTTASVQPEIVVVVDNATDDAERGRVREIATGAGWQVVEPATNVGFGAGMNLGVERALQLGAEDLLLLNPDARIEAPAVTALQAVVAGDRSVVCAPRIVDGSGATWFAGADVYLSDGTTRGAVKRDDHPREERWEWLTGACLLVPDEAWRASGGFDEDYFLYWEDVDFSRRVVAAGGRLRLIEDAVALHEEGGTQNGGTPQRAKSAAYYYYNIRNRMLFAAKHLDAAGVERWRRSVRSSAREVLLRGGRRQFVKPVQPLRAAWRGMRDAERIGTTWLN